MFVLLFWVFAVFPVGVMFVNEIKEVSRVISCLNGATDGTAKAEYCRADASLEFRHRATISFVQEALPRAERCNRSVPRAREGGKVSPTIV